LLKKILGYTRADKKNIMWIYTIFMLVFLTKADSTKVNVKDSNFDRLFIFFLIYYVNTIDFNKKEYLDEWRT